MTIAFTDNFERTNGPLGPNWVVESSTWSITDGRAGAAAAGTAHSTVQPTGANCCQRIHVQPPTVGTKVWTLSFRKDAGGLNYKYVQFSVGTSAVTCLAGHHVGGVNSNLASCTVSGWTWGASVDCMASVAGDLIYAFVDGYLVLVARDPYVPDNGTASMAVGGQGYMVDSYDLYDTGSDPFSITITPPPPEGGNAIVVLTNGGADWTPGTPGAPLFESASGVIVSQSILDANTAELGFTPPNIDAVAQIYDPQNDYYFPFALSTLTSPGAGGAGGGLTTQEHEILLKLETEVDQYLLEQVIYEDPWSVLMGAAWWILGHDITGQTYNFGALVEAVLADDGTLAVILNRLGLARDDIAALAGGEGYNLAGVQEAIRGSASRDLTGIYNLIAALPDPSTDLQTIINILWEIRTVAHSYTLESAVDAIAGVRGAGNPDIAAVLTAINNIPGADNQTILDAIAAVRGLNSPDLAGVLTAIAGVRGTDNPTIHDVLDAIAAIDTSNDTTTLAAILAAIALIPTDPAHDVIEDIDALASALSAVASAVSAIAAIVAALNRPVQTAKAPVWPGLANVTMGDPVALDGGVTINATMHGVVIELSTVPPETDRYMFDAEASYLHVGQVAFANDDGAFDAFQPFSFGKQVLCPLRMSSASKVVVRSALGVGGTVTPWTITTPA